jgi:hypothetical protein
VSLIQQALRKHSDTRAPMTRPGMPSPVRGAGEVFEKRALSERRVAGPVLAAGAVLGAGLLAVLTAALFFFLEETTPAEAAATRASAQASLDRAGTAAGPTGEAKAPEAAPAAAEATANTAAEPETLFVTDLDSLDVYEAPADLDARPEDPVDPVSRALRPVVLTGLRFYGEGDPRNKVFADNRLLRAGDTLIEDPLLKIQRIVQRAVILADESGNEFRKPVSRQ